MDTTKSDAKYVLTTIRKQCIEQLSIMKGANVGINLKGKWGKRNYREFLGIRGNIVNEGAGYVYCLFPASELLERVERELETLRVC